MVTEATPTSSWQARSVVAICAVHVCVHVPRFSAMYMYLRNARMQWRNTHTCTCVTCSLVESDCDAEVAAVSISILGLRFQSRFILLKSFIEMLKSDGKSKALIHAV